MTPMLAQEHLLGDEGPVAHDKRYGPTTTTLTIGQRRANGVVESSISTPRKKHHAATNCSGSFRNSSRYAHS